MSSDITIILTLFKTPLKNLHQLNQYKKFKVILFEQSTFKNNKKNLKKILRFNFDYFFSSRNLGLSKSSNFIFSKVKTRYCLFTQPDILIDNFAIKNLRKIIKKDKKTIFVTPKFSKKRIKKISKKTLSYKIVKKINAACILCDVNKLKKIGFFDEDFFLYWEDIFLMRKINNTNYKMLEANNVYANHEGGKSTENSSEIRYIRSLNFIYGEFMYDFKVKKLRFIKILRKFIQNLILFFFNIIIFELKESKINLAKINGIIKFIIFYLKGFLFIRK